MLYCVQTKATVLVIFQRQTSFICHMLEEVHVVIQISKWHLVTTTKIRILDTPNKL